MLNCSIKGCGACISEVLGSNAELDRWFRARACRCGAALNKMQSCVCRCPDHVHPKITYWPNLDWWLMGGVEEVILCPDHRVLVAKEIVRQQGLDPSMDSPRVNPTNRH